MKTTVSPMVGRTGVEPVTNGLKARYAIGAKSGFPLCAGRMDRKEWPFLRLFCENSPTFRRPSVTIMRLLPRKE